MARASLIAALLLLLAPAAATAQEPVFGPPGKLADGANRDRPAIVIGPNGDTVIAWNGRTSDYGEPPRETRGVFVASRPAGTAAFSAPVRVSDEPAEAVLLARNERGDVALAWRNYPAERGDAGMRLTIARAGEGFGPVENVPVPPGTTPTWRHGGGVSTELTGLAVGGDGTVLLGMTTTTPATDGETRLAAVAVRTPAGFEQTRVLAEHSNGPSVAADGAGRLYAVWLARREHSDSDPAAVFFSEHVGGGFTPPRRLSDYMPSFGGVRIVANRPGDLLVTWVSPALGYSPSQVYAAMRRAGAEWQEPRHLAQSASASPALNDAGDAVVGALGATLVAAEPGGEFGPPEGAGASHGGSISSESFFPVALDSLGTTIATWNNEARSGGVFALRRPRGGPIGPATKIASGTGRVWLAPAIATDAFGNGVIAWIEQRHYNDPATVHTLSYSANPPTVSGFEVGASAFRFKLSEPASVRIKVKRRGGPARSLLVHARTKANVVRFDRRMRSLLAADGRYRATIRARDAGPRASRVRALEFAR